MVSTCARFSLDTAGLSIPPAPISSCTRAIISSAAVRTLAPFRATYPPAVRTPPGPVFCSAPSLSLPPLSSSHFPTLGRVFPSLALLVSEKLHSVQVFSITYLTYLITCSTCPIPTSSPLGAFRCMLYVFLLRILGAIAWRYPPCPSAALLSLPPQRCLSACLNKDSPRLVFGRPGFAPAPHSSPLSPPRRPLSPPRSCLPGPSLDFISRPSAAFRPLSRPSAAFRPLPPSNACVPHWSLHWSLRLVSAPSGLCSLHPCFPPSRRSRPSLPSKGVPPRPGL